MDALLEDDDHHLQEKMMNKHRVLLVETMEVQRFFDKMRSEGVLSLEDCQEMMAVSLYPTDKQRASKSYLIISTLSSNLKGIIVNPQYWGVFLNLVLWGEIGLYL